MCRLGIDGERECPVGQLNRLGLGGTLHLNVRHLWVQQKVKDKEITLEKQGGKKNVADLGTKIQTGPVITNVMGRLGFRFERRPLHGVLKV